MSLKAAMIGTPEYAAWKMAFDGAKESFGRIKSYYPTIYGHESDVGFGFIGKWRNIINNYDHLKKIYIRQHPEVPEEKLEHRTVRFASDIYSRAMEYGGREERIDFFEAINWAQLGDKVRARLSGMHKKELDVDLYNIDRFIGKAGVSEKEKSYNREYNILKKQLKTLRGESSQQEYDEENIEQESYFESISPEELLERENRFAIKKQESWHQKETERISRKWQKKIDKSYDPIRKDQYEQEKQIQLRELDNDYFEKIHYYQNRTKEQLIDELEKRQDLVYVRLRKRQSLADKAIDLYFDGPELPLDCDWINHASFSDIKFAHKLLVEGKSRDEIMNALKEHNGGDIHYSLLKSIVYARHGKRIPLRDFVKGRGSDAIYGNNFVENLSRQYIERFKDGDKNIDFDPILRLAADIYCKYPWMVDGNNYEHRIDYDTVKAFSESKSDSYRYQWCYDNSYTKLEGKWSKLSIGRVIYNRLEAGIEDSLHDASHWLEAFQIPAETYDVSALKLAKKNNQEINLADYKMKCFDLGEEIALLAKIMGLPIELKNRLLLPNKEQKINQLFHRPESVFLYQIISQNYKKDDFSYSKLSHIIDNEISNFYNNSSFGPGYKSLGLNRESDFKETVNNLLSQIESYNIENDEERVGDKLQRLSEYGHNRKKYLDDAISWILKHSTAPANNLTSAWSDRVVAIAAGAEDNIASIKKRKAYGGLNDYIQRNGLPGNLDSVELKTEYENFLDEMFRVYSVRDTIKAISQYKEIHNPEKIMPSSVLKIDYGGDEYYGEVLSHDDPRGMTIGPDTGCCMKLDGQARSCIASGYRDKEAGFFALYNKSNKLMAQSYFYINPDYPEVVVMDNIEAVRGRDVNRIIDLYNKFFSEYLKKQFSSNPEWRVRQVNVGTGFGNQVRPYIEQLSAEKSIPNGVRGVYTDAESQRLILKLSDEEIALARSTASAPETEKIDKINPNREPTVYTSELAVDHMSIVRSLEAELYPRSMQLFWNEDFLYNEITRPGADKYSFLIKSREDANSEAVGYCLAYLDESRTDFDRDEPVVYVADFGIMPDYRGVKAVISGFGEFLSRAKRDGINKIELGARESTSYKLFSSDWGKRFMKRAGFSVSEHGYETNFDGTERTVLISLDAIE